MELVECVLKPNKSNVRAFVTGAVDDIQLSSDQYLCIVLFTDWCWSRPICSVQGVFADAAICVHGFVDLF